MQFEAQKELTRIDSVHGSQFGDLVLATGEPACRPSQKLTVEKAMEDALNCMAPNTRGVIIVEGDDSAIALARQLLRIKPELSVSIHANITGDANNARLAVDEGVSIHPPSRLLLIKIGACVVGASARECHRRSRSRPCPRA